MKRGPFLLALAVGGCGIINTNILSYDYAFDVEMFNQNIGDKGQSSATLPKVGCDPAASPDPCAQLTLPSSVSGQCEPTTKQCIAVADVRLPYAIDLQKAMTSLPPEVLKYTIDHVSIKRIAYWILTDSLNVAVPKIDIYVAPASARNENDPAAQLVGSVAMLPAGAPSCADAVDNNGDSAAPKGVTVCDVTLLDAGQAALATYVKQAANPSNPVPFQLIAHTKLTAKGGDPVPVGQLQFAVRPTVSFSLLK